MSRAAKQRNGGLGQMIAVSTVCHLALYFFLVTFHFTWLGTPREEPVYYVDVVNLPVAHPRAGAPVTGDGAEPPAPVPAPRQMELPARAGAKPAAPTVPAKGGKTPAAGDAAREFEERMERMEREAESKHAAAAVEAIRRRGAGREPAGMPGATGTEAGSDYASYIQSRLRDALATTIAYQSRRPEMSVRLFIDRRGRLVRYVVEKGSGDRLFDDAVLRAIERAKGAFPPPPTGTGFEKLFVFSPQEVNRK